MYGGHGDPRDGEENVPDNGISGGPPLQQGLAHVGTKENCRTTTSAHYCQVVAPQPYVKLFSMVFQERERERDRERSSREQLGQNANRSAFGQKIA